MEYFAERSLKFLKFIKRTTGIAFGAAFGGRVFRYFKCKVYLETC